MKGTVKRRGKTWGFWFDIDPDPLSGKRRQITKSGFRTESIAWSECRGAIKTYEDGMFVKSSKRTVEQAMAEWLERIEHSVKPSMWQNYRNYNAYYVQPYIAKRKIQDLDGNNFNALNTKLLTSGRVKGQPAYLKAKAEKAAEKEADRSSKKRPGPKPKPKPAKPAPPPGLAPKTVVNVHRMMHKAWEDFVKWGWVKRNVVKDAKPPHVPRQKRNVWSISQLQEFLVEARQDRFFALWVLEATTGMRRCELAGISRDALDRENQTLDLFETRVVIDGAVVISDGKTAAAVRKLALDPFTFACLEWQQDMIDAERKLYGETYEDSGYLFCWANGRAPHPDTFTRRFKRLTAKAGLPEIDLHDVRHSYATAGRDADIDWKAMSARLGHADVAFTMKTYVQTDLIADRGVAMRLASLILAGELRSDERFVSKSVSNGIKNALPD